VKILYAVNGKELARVNVKDPSLPATRAGIVPNGTATGNCGESFFYLYITSGRGYKIQTGFFLSGGRVAWDIYWATHADEIVNGSTNAGLDTVEPDVPYWGSSWAMTYYDRVDYWGTHVVGRVTNGKAWIVGGLFCVAGNPNASLWI